MVGIATASQALCLNPLGCEPKTLEDCLADATTRSTDAGVKLAERQCRDRFDRIKTEAVRREAEAFAKQWSKLKTSPRIVNYLLALGEPTQIERGSECGISAPKGEKCITYEWSDRRDKSCVRRFDVSPYVMVTSCSFRVQARESDPDKTVWAVWDESL